MTMKILKITLLVLIVPYIMMDTVSGAYNSPSPGAWNNNNNNNNYYPTTTNNSPSPGAWSNNNNNNNYYSPSGSSGAAGMQQFGASGGAASGPAPALNQNTNNTCPTGYGKVTKTVSYGTCGNSSMQNIMGENACRNAAAEQGYNYRYSQWTSYMPYGCVKTSFGEVYFNQGNYGRTCGYNGYKCLCTSNCAKCPSGTVGNGVDCMPVIATCDVGYGVDIEKITSGTCSSAKGKNLTSAECKLLADASNKNFYTMTGEKYYPVGCFDYGTHNIAFNTKNRWGWYKMD